MLDSLFQLGVSAGRAVAWRRKRQERKFACLREDYYRLFWERAARQVGAELEEVGDGIVRILRGDFWTFVRHGEVMADSRLGLRIAGNKPFVVRLLGPLGFPTARHVEFDLATLDRARAFLELRRRLVIKPAKGDAGRGVTTGIDSPAKMRRASFAAAAFSWQLVAEEQIAGHAYRLLYLDGCLVDALRRDPPAVVGDGVGNIRELIGAENARRLDDRPFTALSALTVDLDCRFALEARGLALSDVPPAGERIVVKHVTSQNSAREQHSVLDQVHPSIKQLGSRAASALGLEFVAIDIVAADIGVPLKDSGGVLIEVNTTPSLHHHTLVSATGREVDVGALLLERQFAAQARRRSVSLSAAPGDRSGERDSSRSSARITVDPEDLRRFALAIVTACGAAGPQAELFARILVWHDLMGRSTQGIWRLAPYGRRVSLGQIRCPCQPEFRETGPATGMLDGDRGFGLTVGHLAMEHAVRLAKQAGTGMVCVSNSSHFGAAAYYVQIAAENGMIGLSMSNSLPKVAAFGGIRPVLGTNPLAFGAPRRNGRTVLVDLATSASAGSTIVEAMTNGMPLEPGVAIDSDGLPTTDAAEATRGALLPFGGAKGYGLALMVEILSGVISGAAISHRVASMYNQFDTGGRNGHFFMAIDIARFMPLETYFDRIELLIDLVRASGRDGGVSIPGEGRWAARDRALREGIVLGPRVAEGLERLAHEHRVAVPWERLSPPTHAITAPAHAGDPK